MGGMILEAQPYLATAPDQPGAGHRGGDYRARGESRGRGHASDLHLGADVSPLLEVGGLRVSFPGPDGPMYPVDGVSFTLDRG
jgi:hypothetical protein